MSTPQQPSFLDFMQSVYPNQPPGFGVDRYGSRIPFLPVPYAVSYPDLEQQPMGFTPWFNDAGHTPWGGRHGRYGYRHHYQGDDVNMGDESRTRTAAPGPAREGAGSNEKEASPDTMQADVPDPAEAVPEDDMNPPPYIGGFSRRGGAHGGRGGCRRGGAGGGRFHRGPPRPSSAGSVPFDFPGTVRGLMGHPFVRNLRDQAERYFPANSMNQNDVDSFEPPVDTFSTERAFVLHVALPGARKEDVGVNWNPEAGVLSIAGVVHRPGDEEFLRTLTSGERRVGVFERRIALPPAGASEKDDVDGLAITAKMEDGILVVTVPKVEKEWTEIRKVDIE